MGFYGVRGKLGFLKKRSSLLPAVGRAQNLFSTILKLALLNINFRGFPHLCVL